MIRRLRLLVTPDRQADRVVPPSEYVASLRVGSLDGFFGGEPGGQRAVYEGVVRHRRHAPRAHAFIRHGSAPKIHARDYRRPARHFRLHMRRCGGGR